MRLGWGVTLQAPGIFFTPAATKASDVFDVYSYKAADTGAVIVIAVFAIRARRTRIDRHLRSVEMK